MVAWAIINSENNKCDNVVLLNEGVNWPTPEGHYRISLEGTDAGIDWTYDPSTGAWTPPPYTPAPEPTQPAGEAGPSVL